MKKAVAVLVIGLIAFWANSQQNDTLLTIRDTTITWSKSSINDAWKKMSEKRQMVKSLIIPSVMITYGLVSLENDGLKHINEEVKEEAWSEHPHQPRHIDNFLKFAPAISVYVLNAVGIHGKNNFRDRTMIYLLSNIMTNAFVFSLKNITHQLRPDGSDYASFPSGHAAEAFVSAEFLRQEYKDVSPWYGVAGYAMAATVGYLRMYNNKHWFSDVVAGAGFGIASTRISYWVYPTIKKWLFKDKPSHTAVMPFYQNRSLGLALVQSF